MIKDRDNLNISMEQLVENIDKIDFNYRTQELVDQLERSYELIASECSVEERKMLRIDFDQFIERGRYVILNIFAGGIIFLREPEIIEHIIVDFNQLEEGVNSTVKYGSPERNARNVKYKPDAGQIESTFVGIGSVLPNFFRYQESFQSILLRIVGKLIQKICEHHKQESWFMKYKKDFDINLSINSTVVLTLRALA